MTKINDYILSRVNVTKLINTKSFVLHEGQGADFLDLNPMFPNLF